VTARCLLIGARGFLGRRIEMKLRASGTDVIGTTRSLAAGDPRNWVQYKFPDDSIKGSIEDERFDFVIVAARLARANTETDPSRGTEAFSFDDLFDHLDRCARIGVTYISTDAVFSGTRGGYVETDEPDATESYGAMQTLAERSIASHVPNHLIVRTSFLFDFGDFHSDRRISLMQKALVSCAPFFGDTNVYKSPAQVADVASFIVDRTLARRRGIVHVPRARQSVYEFFETGLEALGLTQFQEYLVARESDRPSDTSLKSVVE